MNIETTLEQMRESFDWQEAIEVAHRDERTVLRSDHVDTSPFGFGDIAEVLASSEGMNDEESWLALFRLTDGRFAFVSAWCGAPALRL